MTRKYVHHRHKNHSGTALSIIAAVIVVALIAWGISHSEKPTVASTAPEATEQSTPPATTEQPPGSAQLPPVTAPAPVETNPTPSEQNAPTEEQETPVPLPEKKPHVDNSGHVNEPLVPHKDW